MTLLTQAWRNIIPLRKLTSLNRRASKKSIFISEISPKRFTIMFNSLAGKPRMEHASHGYGANCRQIELKQAHLSPMQEPL